MSVKLVIFDKDGTLLDFDAFWVAVSRCAVAELLARIGADAGHLKPLLAAMGVQDGVTDVRGVLCWGTYRLMGETLHEALTRAGVRCDREEIVRLTVETYHRHVDAGELKPTCAALADVLGALRAQGRRLAVVTTDGPAITEKCLQALGVAACFDAICTDDGVLPPKPDPHCIAMLCERFGLKREEIVMVGDTPTDVKFARAGGIRVIAVAKSAENRAYLATMADAVVPDVSGVAAILAAWETA